MIKILFKTVNANMTQFLQETYIAKGLVEGAVKRIDSLFL